MSSTLTFSYYAYVTTAYATIGLPSSIHFKQWCSREQRNHKPKQYAQNTKRVLLN